MKSFRQTRLGFTIIEVMLALGIFSMILIAIYSVWTGILNASRAARTAADSAQRARISMRTLSDALTTAQMFTANMPPQNPNAYYAFLADMNGDFGSLSFVAHLPATFPGVGRYGDQIVRRVKFSVLPEKNGTLDLVIYQAPMMCALQQGWEEQAYSLVLARDVTLFGFEFWAQDQKTGNWEWTSEWSSTNSLPKLVHVGLGLGKTSKPGEPQDVVHRYIAMPTTAVQPEWQMPIGLGGVPVRPGQPARPGQPGQPNQLGIPNNGFPGPGSKGTPRR